MGKERKRLQKAESTGNTEFKETGKRSREEAKAEMTRVILVVERF